jgi:hypothetical protein
MVAQLHKWLDGLEGLQLGPIATQWELDASRLLGDLEQGEDSDPLHDDGPQARYDRLRAEHANLRVD